MPRRGATFTREDAENVAAKLEAIREEGRRPHVLAIVYHEDKRITQFGIRRGSRRPPNTLVAAQAGARRA